MKYLTSKKRQYGKSLMLGFFWSQKVFYLFYLFEYPVSNVISIRACWNCIYCHVTIAFAYLPLNCWSYKFNKVTILFNKSKNNHLSTKTKSLFVWNFFRQGRNFTFYFAWRKYLCIFTVDKKHKYFCLILVSKILINWFNLCFFRIVLLMNFNKI